MSIQEWGVLALVVLLPLLLEGVARLRRAHASTGEVIDRVGARGTSQRGFSLPNRDVDDTVVLAAKQVVSPPPSLPPPLPQPVPPPAISLSRRSASRTSSRDSASVEAHTTNGKSVAGHQVVPWLRPVRNLRRAIVVATILGPPSQ